MIGSGALASSMSGKVDQAVEFLFDQRSMGHRFQVYIDDSNYNLGSWSKVSGLSVDWSPHTYRCGESNEVHILPGGQKYGNISLARAACSESATVKNWLEEVTKEFAPLSGAIMMLNFVQLPVLTWPLWNFYPIGWTISEFDAGANRPCLETLKLAHDGFLDDRVRTGV